MKKINKILAVILSIAVMITTTFAVTVDAYAASKPSETSITSVSAKSSSITVKWKKKSCTGYQIQYSTSSKFKSAKTVKITKAKTTSKTISKLKSSKKYYVRVRTYKKSGKKTLYSKWSKAKNVTTKKSSSTSSSTSDVPVIKSVERIKGTSKFKVTFSHAKGNPMEYTVYASNNKSFSDKKNASDVRFECSEGNSATSLTVDVYDGTPLTTDEILTENYDIKYQTRYFKVVARYLDKNYNETYKTSSIYTYTGPLSDEQEEYPKLMNNAFKEMNIVSSDSDFDKLIKIQKWIDNHWIYSKKSNAKIYNLPKYGYGACNDFAMNFNYFARKAGIKSYMICGGKKESIGHCWNIICINGYWYEYDCENYSIGCTDRANFTEYGRANTYYILDNDNRTLYENCNPKATAEMHYDMESKFLTAKKNS